MAILAIAFNFLYNIFEEKMYFKVILKNKNISFIHLNKV